MTVSGASRIPAAGGLRRQIMTRAIQLLLQNVLLCALLLACAGSFDWWNAWAYIGLSLALSAASGVHLLSRNPGVIAGRTRPHRGTERFDVVLTIIMTAAYLGMLVVAGLDAGRWRWAPLAWPLAVLGAVFLVIGMFPVTAALAVNPHLETTVRIQVERWHRAITEGPYRLVRHPMYVGMLVQTPAAALLLGSGWALVPAVGFMVLLVIRTGLEDRTLRRGLPGYQEYAARTRFRLIPGLW